MERLGQVNVPHSLGLLYEQVTGYLGFLHSADEYKVMALASFGQPRYVAKFCLGQACSGPSCQRHADLLQAGTQVVRVPPGHRDEVG
jgi:Carbamoyltransferase N-terminus